MRILFYFALLCPWLVNAQTVQITEIAPHTLALQPEWFEFRVSGLETIDMTDWHISNGENKSKPFKDFMETLTAGEGATATDNPFIFLSNQTAYFSFSPSPINLPNGGGTLQILAADAKILAELTYPKAKSRSTKDYEEREVWAWNEDFKTLNPVKVRAPEQIGFAHSRGKANPALATPANQFELLINEVSVDHDEDDFIEIYIPSGPKQINLQYTEIKHNGTQIWYFEQPFRVQPESYLIFKVGTPNQGKASEKIFHSNARDGLSGGSGTVEIIHHSGTSLETWGDTLCWQKSEMSETEKKRVQKFIEAKAWQGACVSIADLIPNESIARLLGTQNSHTKAEWFRHFNGSIGEENQTKNHVPQAVITLQGTKKAVAVVPFLLNPTGENSSDPDGTKDLKSFEWKFDNMVISDEVNPAGFYVETLGEHTLSLTVTDQSGASHTANQLIVGLEKGNRNTNHGSVKAQLAVINQILETARTNSVEQSKDSPNFWDAYMKRPSWNEALLQSRQEVSTYPNYESPMSPVIEANLYEEGWVRQINLPKPVRKRLKKNLGILFSWRESPWPDLAAEWNAVVEADRKFGYFALVYRGF